MSAQDKTTGFSVMLSASISIACMQSCKTLVGHDDALSKDNVNCLKTCAQNAFKSFNASEAQLAKIWQQ